MVSCVFCIESVRPEYANVFLEKGWPYCGRTIWSGEHVFAVPGLGPQVFPYALILPRRHIGALSEVSAGERSEVLSALSFLESLNVFEGPMLSVFEHGSCKGDASGACLEHAHLHVVSGRFGVVEALQSDHDVARVTFDKERTIACREDYLFAGHFDGEKIEGVVADAAAEQSQYFRRAIADMIGNPRWDWREMMNPDFMRLFMHVAVRQKQGRRTTPVASRAKPEAAGKR